MPGCEAGAFSVDDALSLDEAEERFADGSWREVMHSPDVALRGLRAIIVGTRIEEMVRNGRLIDVGGDAGGDAGGDSGGDASPLRQPRPGERCRAYTTDGRFLAIVAYDADLQHWKPDKVFALTYPRINIDAQDGEVRG